MAGVTVTSGVGVASYGASLMGCQLISQVQGAVCAWLLYILSLTTQLGRLVSCCWSKKSELWLGSSKLFWFWDVTG